MSVLYGQDRSGRRVAVEKRGDEVYVDGELATSIYYAGGRVTIESATKDATLEKRVFEGSVPTADLPSGQTHHEPETIAPRIPDAAFRTRPR